MVQLGTTFGHFAAGESKNMNYPAYNCPCAIYPGSPPPSFVGEKYFCESGVVEHGHLVNGSWTTLCGIQRDVQLGVIVASVGDHGSLPQNKRK